MTESTGRAVVVGNHAHREGPFWDVMRGDAPAPAAADTLGWELLAIDPDTGTIEVGFEASDAFLNPLGVVQGGFLAAMLDDTMGPALVATLGRGEFAPTRSSIDRRHRASTSVGGEW